MPKAPFKQLQLIRSYFSMQNLLYILLVFLFLVPWLVRYGEDDDNGGTHSSNNFRALADLEINDTLSHYKKLLDSVNTVAEDRKQLNEGKVYLNNKFFLSTASIQYYKSSTAGNQFSLEDSARCYFVTTYPYLKDEDVYFKSTKTGSYLGYPTRDSAQGGKAGYPIFKRGNYAKNSLDIGFSEKHILVPVSKSQFDIVEGVGTTLTFLLIIPCLVVFLSMPLNILVSISKGRPFEKANMRNLKVIGWSCVAIPAISLVQQVLLRIAFYRYVPSGFHFQYFFFYAQFHGLLLLGVIVLIIAKAFEKGYRLQQEQDFTI